MIADIRDNDFPWLINHIEDATIVLTIDVKFIHSVNTELLEFLQAHGQRLSVQTRMIRVVPKIVHFGVERPFYVLRQAVESALEPLFKEDCVGIIERHIGQVANDLSPAIRPRSAISRHHRPARMFPKGPISCRSFYP